MEYYISASDETSGDDHRSPFTHGGFIADSRARTNDLVPAWGAMLAAPPSMTALHMNELRDGKWCKANGLTQSDANRKIDRAISIVVGLPTIVRLRITQDGGAFKDHIASLLRRPDFMGSVPPSDKSSVRSQLDSPDIPALIGYWPMP